MKIQFVSIVILCLARYSAAQEPNPKPKNDIPDYTQSERASVPEELRWRLEDIYATPAAWQSDLVNIKRTLSEFESLLDTASDQATHLAACLALRERAEQCLFKLDGYASLQSQVQWQNARYQDMQSEVRQLWSAFFTHTARLETNLLRSQQATLAQLLAHEPALAAYRVYLQQIIAKKEHTPTPEVAAVLAQTRFFSDGPQTAATCLRDLDMPAPEALLADGKKIPLTAQNWRTLSQSKNATARRAADEAQCLNRKHYENTFAALLDMSVKRDCFDAKTHMFPDCLSAEFFPYAVPAAVYRTMLQTIRTHLAPYHRYLNLRKRLLGLTELHPYDEYLPAFPGEKTGWSFAEARKLVEQSLQPLGKEYSRLVSCAFDQRWFDVYMHKDKMNMGSAQQLKGVHPFINLDFRGSYFDLITVTHELGHALSFYLAENAQPYAAADIVWFASEIPSTFNETLLMNHLQDQAGSEKHKLMMLAKFIDRLNTLLFFDARHAEMQLAMHEHVENGGTLSPAWLNAKQLELTRLYQGQDQKCMIVDDYTQSEWNHPGMYFSPFQSYFYVIGSVVSLALHDKILSDPLAAQKYIAFLKSGSSRPILDVLRELGIDLTTAQPYLDALAVYNRLIVQLEALSERVRLQE